MSVTPEEINDLIEANRKRLRDAHADQMFERDVAALSLEDIPDDKQPEDTELETHRYEPVNQAEVQEI